MGMDHGDMGHGGMSDGPKCTMNVGCDGRDLAPIYYIR